MGSALKEALTVIRTSPPVVLLRIVRSLSQKKGGGFKGHRIPHFTIYPVFRSAGDMVLLSQGN